MNAIYYLSKYFSKRKWLLTFYVFLALGRGFILLPIPFLLQQLLEKLNTSSFFLPLFLIASLLVLGMGEVLLSFISRVGIVTLVKECIATMRVSLINTIINSPHSSSWRKKEHLTTDTIVNDTERLDIALTVGLGQTLPAVITALLFCIVLFFISPLLTALSIGLLPFLLVGLLVSREKVNASLDEFHTTFSAFTRKVNFAISSWELIKLQTAEKAELSSQKTSVKQIHQVSRRLAHQQIILQSIQEFSGVLLGFGLLATGLFFSSRGVLSSSEVIVFFITFSVCRLQLNTVFTTSPYIVSAGNSLSRIFQLIHMIPRPPYKGKRRHLLTGSLTVNNLSVSFDGRKILDNISFTLHPKQLTVITGKNGEGKSTLLATLLGLLPPDSGTIQADDISFTQLNMTHYRKQVSVVSQQLLFTDESPKSNVMYGSAIKVKALNEIDDDLAHLPISVDDFSGGEKQWLALHRAYRRHPKILYLDEPTNHLDEKRKKSFFKKLTHLLSESTILCITHDEEIIRRATTHYHLEKGRLLLRRSA